MRASKLLTSLSSNFLASVDFYAFISGLSAYELSLP